LILSYGNRNMERSHDSCRDVYPAPGSSHAPFDIPTGVAS
jgi:hypothetical protein